MKLGGLQKFSLLDYPGKVSAIVFTQGCNFRCHYCYNPMLVWPLWQGKVIYPHQGADTPGEDHKGHPLKEGDLFDFLKKRKGKLDAVVITGGEPTIQKNLPKFLAKIKAFGFLIKLDTNGSNPEMLKKIVEKNLVDYIAMDLKTSFPNYEAVCAIKLDLDILKKSIKIIRESGIAYEFRTTLIPELVKKEDIESLGKEISGAGVWYLQQFKNASPLVNERFQGKLAYKEEEAEEMRKIALKYVKKCEIR